MRIVFMGSPDFAVPTLDAIVAAGHAVTAVYTQPPRAAGRGKGERRTAVHARAVELGLDVRHPARLRDPVDQQAFAALDADVAVVAAYGLILPRAILDAPRLGCVNVHASLLPRWRGAAPIQRAIEAGDVTTGVTIMQMEEGLDTGPMLLTREVSVGHSNAGQLTRKLAEVGAAAMVEWLANPAGFVARAQPAEGATYAAKIAKAEARIDWSQEAATVERKVRALAPAPGAWFEAAGERVRLLDAEVVTETGVPGTILDDRLTIACGADALRARSVQRAGRGVMTAGELLRGFALPAGTRLP